MEDRRHIAVMFTDIAGYTALMGDRVLRNDPVDHFNEGPACREGFQYFGFWIADFGLWISNFLTNA